MLKNIADSTLLMKAKDARNLIITLIVLAIGLKILTTLGSRYATQAGAAALAVRPTAKRMSTAKMRMIELPGRFPQEQCKRGACGTTVV